MTRQTWTAAISALLFVLAAGFIALVPVPYVTFAPGATYDVLATGDAPVITVEGVPTYPSSGELRLTTVRITERGAPVSLPEALYAHWAPEREVYPREAVYRPGSASAQPVAEDPSAFQTTASDAAAAALRAAGVEVRQIPMVSGVAAAGPAADHLQPGDFVLAVDGVPTPTVAAVDNQVASRSIGETVTFTVLRDRAQLDVSFDTAASKTQAGVPVWGGNLTTGYSYAPRVTFGLGQVSDMGSAGLMLALGVFDRVTPGDLASGQVVAGAGRLDGTGAVGAVSGIRERLAAAEQSGAGVFLIPTANCRDIQGLSLKIRVVSVASLDDAIGALDALADPSTQGMVRGCS